MLISFASGYGLTEGFNAARQDDLKVNGDGSTGVSLVFKKNSASWKIVYDYNEWGGDGDDPNDHVKGIPPGILMPWDN